MSLPIHLIFAAVLLASGTHGMKWGLWKQKGIESSMVVVYDSRDECQAQAKNLNQSGDGYRYLCRAR